jgi:adenosylcobinamide-phosphate synthase
MIGHKTPRHLAFGWAAARLDDLVNLPASRLTALLLVAAAALDREADAAEAWRAVGATPAHRSPNAGWPEAAMAGALGLRARRAAHLWRDTRRRWLDGRWPGRRESGGRQRLYRDIWLWGLAETLSQARSDCRC